MNLKNCCLLFLASSALLGCGTEPVPKYLKANPDVTKISEDTQLSSFNVLENDVISEGISKVSVKAKVRIGQVGVNSDNSVNYLPPPNFTGLVFIDYEVTDGERRSSSSLGVSVMPANDKPKLKDLNVKIYKGEKFKFVPKDIIEDVDVENAYIVNIDGEPGEVVPELTYYVYYPPEDYTGMASITVTFTDSYERTTDTFTIQIVDPEEEKRSDRYRAWKY